VSLKRESLRGTGRDTAGATSVTMQIWYELQQAGQHGLSFEELLDKVTSRVPAGYAWRRYLKHRSSLIQSRGSSFVSDIEDSPSSRASSIRYVVRASVQSMVQLHSAIRRPDSRYAVGPRKPKSVFTDEQHDFDGSVSRRAVADMELMRILTGPDGILALVQERRRRHKNMPTVSTQLAAALDKWAEAHRPAST
jgi:hypothetical protein